MKITRFGIYKELEIIMEKKKKSDIKILLSFIPIMLFIVYAIIQIPVCMRNVYPTPMLGIDAMNWFDAWLLNVGIVFMCSFFVLIPCIIILIKNIFHLFHSK